MKITLDNFAVCGAIRWQWRRLLSKAALTSHCRIGDCNTPTQLSKENVMRMRAATALLCALAVVGLIGFPHQVLAAGPVPCVGNFSNETIPRGMEVPAGTTCTLTDVNVMGNIRINAGASLSLNGGTVAGNIHGIHASLFFMVPDGASNPVTVNGNVLMLNVASVEMSRGTVKGNFIANKSTSIGISGTAFGRNLVVSNTVSTIQILGTTIGDDFIILGNDGNAFIAGNTVSRSLLAMGNTGGIALVSNVVSRNLICRGNVPAATGQCTE